MIEQQLAKITIHGNRSDEDIARLRANPSTAQR
jgi:hypothetical protein